MKKLRFYFSILPFFKALFKAFLMYLLVGLITFMIAITVEYAMSGNVMGAFFKKYIFYFYYLQFSLFILIFVYYVDSAKGEL